LINELKREIPQEAENYFENSSHDFKKNIGFIGIPFSYGIK